MSAITATSYFWLHGDQLGSASLTTDASGNRYSELRYSPFGQTRWSSGTMPTDRQFTSQRLELYAQGFGAIYDFGARFYDPSLGRFLSPDTIVPDPGDPQTLNHYSCALNNALKYTDPSGHDVCSFMIGFGGMFGAIASAFCAPPRPAQTISDGPVSGPWSKQPWNIEKPVDIPMDKVPRGDRPVDDPWGKQQPYDGPLRDGSDTKPKIITAQEAEDTGLIYWTTVTEYDGKTVYQRDDLIDPNMKDPNGITNLELMRSGRSPLGPDQKPIILHHMLQTNDSPIAELSSTFNDRYRRIIHINPRTIPSDIDRARFDDWRRQYWRERANEIVQRRQKYQ